MDMRKYTPVRAEVNLAVLDAIEFGLFVKWSQEQLPSEAFLDYAVLQTYDEKKPMKFDQLIIELVFCATGLAAGVAVLVLEIARAKLSHEKKTTPHVNYTSVNSNTFNQTFYEIKY